MLNQFIYRRFAYGISSIERETDTGYRIFIKQYK